MTTGVAGGPLSGETRLIAGGWETYVKTCDPTPHVPSEFTTTTFTPPGVFAGAVACIVLESTTRMSVPANPAKYTRAPERKFVPLTVTSVPPSIGPAGGATEIAEGELSVMTNAPETIELSVPRLTARFFGPSAVDGKTVNSIDTLVGAVELSRPPNVSAPN